MKLTSGISIGDSLRHKRREREREREATHAKREAKEERQMVNRNKPRIVDIGSGEGDTSRVRRGGGTVGPIAFNSTKLRRNWILI